jgi:hypothetical protein
VNRRLPAERTIKGRRRIVVLIVICDACGNREVGWAWRDRGQLRFEGEIEPVPDLGGEDEIRETHGVNADAVLDGDWAELKRQHGRLAGPFTERSIVAYLTADDHVDGGGGGRLYAYCPRHGGVISAEAVDLDTVPLDSTRRVRAYPKRTG